MQPKSSDFVYKKRDCLTLVFRQSHCALVPADVAFEATSYNWDGTVFCRFNQNGEMEVNEYDAAGRLTRVKDRHGNVIKEYQYNVVELN